MRKTFFTLLAASIALVACQKEADLNRESLGEKVTITLTASHDEQTKTTLSGTSAVWTSEDKVTVMYKQDGKSGWFTSESAAATSSDSYATATFTADLTSPDAGESAYAIYPANNLSQTVADKAKITIAATQHPTGTGFDGASDIMISKPFTPSTDPITTQFARANAVLKIKINNATLASEKLVSLEVEGENDLAGDVLVGLSDHEVKGIENGSHTVTAEYATANQFELGADGKFVYLIVKPQKLSSGEHLIINGVTRNYTFTKDITLTEDIYLNAGHIMPLNITITSITLTAKKDVIDYDATGLGTSGSYTTWSDIAGSVSDAVYEGRSYPNSDNFIQMNNSGIASTTSGGAISKVEVVWNSKTKDDGTRSLIVYGKNTAYSGQSDLASSSTYGKVIGSIVCGTSDYLNIDGYYEYIGIYATGGANYVDEVSFYWNNGKAATGLVWKKSGAKATTDTATMLTGDDTMPTIALDNPNSLTVVYASSDPSVATINSSTGAITLVGAGDTVISASYAGDETYKPDNQSYTLTVTDSRTSCATPSFSVAAGEVAENTVVRISSNTVNATVYYKVGSAPTTISYDGVSTLKDASDKPYIDVTIDVAKTIYAIAAKDDWKTSESVSAAYTIEGVATPLSAPTGVTITAMTPNSFNASWTASANADGYAWVLSSADDPGDIAAGNTKASGNIDSGSTVTLSKTGLTGDYSLSGKTSYYFYIKAKGSGSWSDSSYASDVKGYMIFDGDPLSSTATDAVTDKTYYSDFTLTFSSGAKKQAVQSGATNMFVDGQTILIGKTDAYINNNKSAVPGTISKFEIYANKGASTKVSVGVKFSASTIASYNATGAYTATLSTVDSVYDCSAKLVSNSKYFWYQVTNNNNSQVQFRILYTPD